MDSGIRKFAFLHPTQKFLETHKIHAHHENVLAPMWYMHEHYSPLAFLCCGFLLRSHVWNKWGKGTGLTYGLVNVIMEKIWTSNSGATETRICRVSIGDVFWLLNHTMRLLGLFRDRYFPMVCEGGFHSETHGQIEHTLCISPTGSSNYVLWQTISWIQCLFSKLGIAEGFFQDWMAWQLRSSSKSLMPSQFVLKMN